MSLKMTGSYPDTGNHSLPKRFLPKDNVNCRLDPLNGIWHLKPHRGHEEATQGGVVSGWGRRHQLAGCPAQLIFRKIKAKHHHRHQHNMILSKKL